MRKIPFLVALSPMLSCTFIIRSLDPEITCRNGVLEAQEECDDGNDENEDACRNNCQNPSCGDGILDAGEECDDGNTQSADGCDAQCKEVVLTCGDNTLDPKEECDGADLNQLSCVDLGFTGGVLLCNGACQFDTSGCTACGDGVVVSGVEDCDDGDTTPGDGCSEACTIEPGFSCSGEPSVCVDTCGNGIIEAGEECDDNNTINGDGCDSDCTACGNGIHTPGEICYLSASTLLVGDQPFGIEVGELNGDGFLDFVVAIRGNILNPGDDVVQVFTGDGTGQFAGPTDFSVDDFPVGVALGDLNNDTALDLVVANFGNVGTNSTVSVLLNDGDAQFGAPLSLTADTGVIAVAVGNFNGGALDIVATNTASGFAGADDSISVFLNNNATPGVSFAPSSLGVQDFPAAVVVGDWDKDGAADLAVANLGSLNGGGNQVSIIPGNGNGTFAGRTDVTVAEGPISLASGDWDNDQDLDLAVVCEDDVALSLLRNDGAGIFTAAPPFVTSGKPNAIVAKDFDLDGDLDLATSNADPINNVSLFTNNGAGVFSLDSFFPVGTNPVALSAGDVNGDGLPDLIVSNTGSDDVSVLLSNP